MASKDSNSCITNKITYNSLFIFLLVGCVGMMTWTCESDGSPSEKEEITTLIPLVEEFDESEQKWGFIDQNGAIKIQGDYDELGNFSEGLASFRKKSKWGYLNLQGSEVIPNQYYNAFAFHNGLAKVSNFERKYGMIDSEGKVIIPIEYDGIRNFKEELCAVLKDGKWTYINAQNETVIKGEFDAAKDFNNGKAIVKLGKTYHLINKSGKKISKDFNKITALSNEHFKVKSNKKYGILNPSGQMLIQPTYKRISLSNGQVVAVKQEDEYSLLALPETKIPTPTNDNIEYLDEDRWAYEVNGKVGLLDNDGQVIMQPKYSIITPFKDGFASYQSGRLWGFLDRDGEILTPPVFGLTWEFKEGLARVIGRQGVGYINKQGRIAFIAEDYDARDFSEGLARMPMH